MACPCVIIVTAERITVSSFTHPQINLFADEVEPSVDFYCSHFGFVETFRTPNEGAPDHVEMQLDGFTLGVAARSAGAHTHGLELRAGPPQCDLVLWCADVDQVVDDLTAADVQVVSQPHDFLDNRAAWVQDPAGHLVSIVSKRR